ncbi:MAG: metallophosphoesterase [Prevotella sp.]|jgi:predicted MPP superfamily phosphohydrolase|nr:metallophosphoesterase [Prevotella sp.]MCH3970316.1 metallophosphoesterase [Prevotella sp.]MCI1291837.1 metallophosphoesterase [Prevotella sp.]MCI1684476.1 metallophosphoesterase [Prevotella sp.]MCI1780676.1 metallophosphoesterase [Prevotella sp.]MCI1817142.1 metallophosphoesterase [Prevotella sp.]
MKLTIHHNSLVRGIFGAILFIGIPGLVFLILWPFLGWLPGVIGAGCIFLIAVYGLLIGWRHIKVRRVSCVSPLLPQAFEGYRILQLSDIHIGTFLKNRSFITKVVDMVQKQKVDLIVFTGDLVNVSAEEIIPFTTVLDRLHAPDGVLSVLGNHDYCEYGKDTSEENIRKNQKVLHYLEEKMGWKLLLNDHVLIHRPVKVARHSQEEAAGRVRGESCPDAPADEDSTIAVIGVENISRPPFQSYGDLDHAMKGLPEGMFKILLSHDPHHWRMGVLHHTDIALTLSGHTHAGQLRIGHFSPVKWFYHEWGGKYTEDGSMLYVSTGIGGTMPFRLGDPPEIPIIELHRPAEG